MTKWERNLRSFPPFLVRLCARKNHGNVRLTRAEIIVASGLPGRTVDKLSMARSWDCFTAGAIFAFTAACGVDLSNFRRHKEYLKRRSHVAWRERPDVYAKILQEKR